MSVTVAALSKAVADAQAAMAGLEQELNAADAKLGDGDTGTMLARVIAKMAEQPLSGDDVGAALGTLARATASATGSSLGTLFATALLTISRGCKGETEVAVARLPDLLAQARDAMIARGGAALGDKTVLDSLDAVVAALSENPTPAAALEGAQSALEAFRGKPNRVGRARMFGDATIGIDDPGMLAFARLSQAVLSQSA